MSEEKRIWAQYQRARTMENRNAVVEYYWPLVVKIAGSLCRRIPETVQLRQGSEL